MTEKGEWAEVADEGQALVSGRLLADITKALPNKPVDLEVEGNKVAVSCGSARFSLAAMAADDYPALPVMPAVAGTIDAHDLARAVGQVSIAAAGAGDELLLVGASVNAGALTARQEDADVGVAFAAGWIIAKLARSGGDK